MNQMTSPVHSVLADAGHAAGQELRSPIDRLLRRGGNNFPPPRKPRSAPPALPKVPKIVEYWRAISLFKWPILAFTVVVAVLATIYVARTTPVYRSTATVMIEASKAKIVSVEEVYTGANGQREYFQTQAENLKSRAVALKVVQKLKLTAHPEFDPRQSQESMLRTWMRSIVPSFSDLLFGRVLATEGADVETAVLRDFATRLSIEPVRLSQLIKISFEARDATLAADIANLIGEAFIQTDMEARVKMTQNAGSFITEQLTQLKVKMEAADKAVQAYREREGILDSKSVVLGGMGKQLDELTQKLVEARARRSEAEEAYNQVKGIDSGNFDSVPAVVRHPGIQRARESESEAEKKYQELASRYGANHPQMQGAVSDLAVAKANTKKQVQNIVTSIAKEFNAAKATERTFEEQINGSKGQIQNLSRKEIQAVNLEREAATNRQLYQTFLSRQKETTATADAQAPSARIVEIAIPSIRPARPNLAETVGTAVVLALFLGVAAALLFRHLNNQVNTRAEVETKLFQPLLAALPVMSKANARNAGMSVIDNPHDIFAEAIRTAGTGLMLSGLDTPHKVIAVTSSVPGEGKSTFSLNLALWQAKTKPTLLIEGDMRRPTLGPQLNLAADQKGLSDLIAGTATLEQCMTRHLISGLDVIAAGTLPPNPVELLMSTRFAQILAELQGRYEIIIVDCAPLHLVSDVLVVGQNVTGLVYVVKAGDTSVETAKEGLKRIASSDIPIIGVVLNKLNYERAEKYYGDYAGYGTYGEQYGYK